jgi:protein-tyrosine phosphatase
MIDLHSHVIPGVDDGAAGLDEAVAAVAAMRAQGVHTVVATPHLRGSTTRRPAELDAYRARVDTAWGTLVEAAARDLADVRLARGYEVMLDTPSPDLSDAGLRLAGTDFVLVEFPFMSIPVNSAGVLAHLRAEGWNPVVAHPERYGEFTVPLAAAWRAAGACLQVNAGSLLGRYGPGPRAHAWGLLRLGMADYLSSDYHARGELRVAAARTVLEEAGGGEQARLLMEDNPARLLLDQPPLPVAPLPEHRSLLARLLRR